MIRNLILSTLLVATVTGAELDTGTFVYQRDIASPAGKERLLSLPLDPEIYSRLTHDSGDLEIVDLATRYPVGYLVRSPRVTRKVERTVAIETSIVSFQKLANNRIRLISRVNDGQPLPSVIEIDTSLSNFERQVVVESSMDGVNWSEPIAKKRIFDYRRFVDLRNTTIHLPEDIDFRYLRVTIDRGVENNSKVVREMTRYSGKSETVFRDEYRTFSERVFQIEKIEFCGTTEVEVSGGTHLNRYPIEDFVSYQDTEKDCTVVEWRGDGVPVNAFEFSFLDRNYKRRVVLKGKKTEGSDWIYLKSKDFFHYELEDFKRTDLGIGINEQRMALYQLSIFNQSAPPIEIGGITNIGPAYELVWLANEGKQYGAWFGNTDIGIGGNRDISFLRVLMTQAFPIENVAWEGKPKANEGFRFDEPVPDLEPGFFDRPEVLWSIISLAVLLLVFVLFQTGRKIEALE